MFIYLSPNPTAGYSGFVVYLPAGYGSIFSPSTSIWLVPGTFFIDWDNQTPGEHYPEYTDPAKHGNT